MTLTDKELIEEIKKIKVEKSIPKWDYFIKRRYLGWEITKEGDDTIVKFVKTIGEGPILFDTWYGIGKVRSIIKETGFAVAKNKVDCSYTLFKIKKDSKPSFTFNPKLLYTENNDENEKTGLVQQA